MCSDPTVSLALVAEHVSRTIWPKGRLVQRDRLGEGYPQRVQVGSLLQGQPVRHPCVDLIWLFGSLPRVVY